MVHRPYLRYIPLFFLLIITGCKPLSLLDELPGAEDFDPVRAQEEGSPWGVPRDFTVVSGGADSIPLSWKAVDGAVYYNIFYAESPHEFSDLPSAEVKAADFYGSTVSWELGGTEAEPLPSGAVYYFMVGAVNAAGTSGPLTPAAPGALLDTPEPAQPVVEQGEVMLRWYIPNLLVQGINYSPSFIIEYSENGGDFHQLPGTDGFENDNGVFSFRHIDLKPETKYSYRFSSLSAVAGGGYSSVSEIAVFTPVQTHPNRIKEFTASEGLFADSVNLSWQAPEPLAGHENEPVVYTIFRKQGDLEESLLAENIVSESFSDTSAPENTSLRYRIISRFKQINDGATVFSDAGTGLSAEGYRLWVPENLVITEEPGALKLGWEYPSDKQTGAVFRIIREADDIGGEVTELAAAYSGLTYTDDTAVPGCMYHYSVRALKRQGEGTELSAELRTGEPVGIDSASSAVWFNGFRASDGRKSDIGLRWEGSAGVRYSVYMNYTGYGYTEDDLIASNIECTEDGALMEFADQSLPEGEHRFYRLRGVKDGAAQLSAPVPGSTLAMPKELTASKGLFTRKIRLDWQPAAGADGYRVYVRKEGEPVFSSAGVIDGSDSCSFEYEPPGNSDPLQRGLTWEFSVSSLRHDDQGAVTESGLSDTAAGMTLGPAEIALQASRSEYNDRVVLSWSAVEGADTYDLFRGRTNDPELAVKIFSGLTDTEAEDRDTAALIQGCSLYYFIRPLRTGISSNILSAAVEGRALSPPYDIEASRALSATDITVSWKFPPDAVSCSLYRRAGDGWTLVAGGLTGTEYSYPLPSEALAAGDVAEVFMLRSVSADGLTSLDSPEQAEGSALSRPMNVTASNGDKALKGEDGRFYTRIFWPPVAGAVGYQVERRDDRDSAWHKIAVIPQSDSDIVEHADPDALILRDYRQSYRVKSLGAGGIETAYSSVVEGYRQLAPAEYLNAVLYSLRSSRQRGLFRTNASSEKRVDGDAAGYGTTSTTIKFIGADYRSFSYHGYRDFFLTLDGSFHQWDAWCAAGGEHTGTYKHSNGDSAALTVTGPSGTGLYSGSIRFNDVSIPNNSGNNPGWESGTIHVEYGGLSADFGREDGIPFSLFMDDATLLRELGVTND